MAKIRGIKPDLWTDEDFVELSPYARLLWLGMWNYACDNGHLADKSKQIKMRVLPTDDVNCAELLREIEAQGLIERANGWITVPNLTRHQKVDRRYFTSCEKEGCEAPPQTVSQRESRRAPAVHTSSARRVPDGGTPSALGDGDGDGELKGSDGDRARGGKGTTRLPAKWSPTEEHKKRATETGLDLDLQVTKFRLHAEENGRKAANWNAAFTRWLMNAAEWNTARAKPAAPSRPHVSLLESAPPGMTDEQYDAWEAAQIEKRRRA